MAKYWLRILCITNMIMLGISYQKPLCRPGTSGESGVEPCLPCFIGDYAPGIGFSDCRYCPKYSTTAERGSTKKTDCYCIPGYSGINGGKCTACKIGTYAESAASENCTSCPDAGSTTLFTGATSSDKCNVCAPGYYGNYGDGGQLPCYPCEVGTYTASAGAERCTSCSKGTTTSARGSSSCNVCAPGYDGVRGQTPCTACEKGTYAEKVGTERCTSCDNRRTTSDTGSTSSDQCNVCTPGHYGYFGNGKQLSCNPCEIGTYADKAGTLSCTACDNSGTTSDTGSTSSDQCNVCAPGHYGYFGNGKQLSCNPCEIGTYADKAGTLSCTSCDNRRTTSDTGSTSSDQCNVCAPGHYGYFGNGKQLSCNPCEIGTYADKEGTVSCTSCDNRRTTSDTGSTSSDQCNVCAPGHYGYFGNGKQLSCNPCEIGTYADKAGTLSCTSCNNNRTTSDTGSTSSDQCNVCDPGHYGYFGNGKQLLCNPCEIGTYADKAGTLSCTSCVNSKTTSDTGSTSSDQCNVCAPGYHGVDGEIPCTPCEIGTYARSAGTANCTSCPSTSTTTSIRGATQCNVCRAGYRGRRGRAPCKICKKGTYAKRAGLSRCTRCPKDTRTLNSGAYRCVAIKPAALVVPTIVSEPRQGSDCQENNPCVPSVHVPNKYYYSHRDPYKFVQCNNFGECWGRDCAPGTRYNDDFLTCVHDPDA